MLVNSRKVPVYLVMQRNGHYEYHIPPMCTFYKQITMGTKWVSQECPTIDDVLKRSQNSVINLELFEMVLFVF
jgi:hypothetical protein